MKDRKSVLLTILISSSLIFGHYVRADGIFELLDPCAIGNAKIETYRSDLEASVYELGLKGAPSTPTEEFTNLWWAEKRALLMEQFQNSDVAAVVVASGDNEVAAFSSWTALQIEKEGGIARIDDLIAKEYRRIKELAVAKEQIANPVRVDGVRAKLYGDCAKGLLEQRMQATLVVELAQPLYWDFEISASERGELAKVVRATTGISVSDIQRYGVLGGPNSEFRNLFGSLVDGKDNEYATVPIWYVTDRQLIVDRERQLTFSGSRGADLSYGAAAVTIPTDHRMGELEAPTWWKFEFRADPSKHVVLNSVKLISSEKFFRSLRVHSTSNAPMQILVFVHGYNVSFEDGARRTAQMAYDLNFDGAAILYSWPSEAKLSSYFTDSNNAEWTVPHLEKFLTSLADNTGNSTIHLIAHSMGNRAMVRALYRLSHSEVKGRRFNQIVLAAPDIDADVFRELAETVVPLGSRTTLYASNSDKALETSKSIVGDYPRAGEAGDKLVVLSGVDTIDVTGIATGFLGHSYYGDNRSILTDMFHLIRDGSGPESRFGLSPSSKNGRPYWIFRP